MRPQLTLPRKTTRQDKKKTRMFKVRIGNEPRTSSIRDQLRMQKKNGAFPFLWQQARVRNSFDNVGRLDQKK